MFDEHCPTSGKRSYHDKDAALIELRKLRRGGSKGKKLVGVYRCRSRRCAAWHLTSTKDKDQEDWIGFINRVDIATRFAVRY